jgi:uncharacterized protein (DUF427 family)
MKAVWKGTVIAESPDTVIVEGNHYFPRASVNEALLEPSTHTSVCPWKGTAADFYTSLIDGSFWLSETVLARNHLGLPA